MFRELGQNQKMTRDEDERKKLRELLAQIPLVEVEAMAFDEEYQANRREMARCRSRYEVHLGAAVGDARGQQARDCGQSVGTDAA